MAEEVLFIKNMVCHRCVLAVEDALHRSGVPFLQVVVGEVRVDGKITDEQRDVLRGNLGKIGLELIDDRVSSMIEKIKQLILKKARAEVDEKEKQLKLSVYLSQRLHHEYTYLSSLFSSVEGRTIEQYFIEQRIERVKELLVYNDMTLSQIAFEMDYSSVSHLSNQFKKVTGLTPSYFKTVGSSRRKLLDEV